MEYKRSKYGSKNLAEMFKVLENRINLAKEQHSDSDIILQTFDQEKQDPFILVVVTPLMKRVHEKVNIHSNFVFSFLLSLKSIYPESDNILKENDINTFSILHFNIRSMQKNFGNFKQIIAK